MDFGLVSVIMPSYNSSKYIKDSINSVINQTYKNWELIVVDDCSTDDTVKIIKSFNDERIRFFQNDHNSGAALTRNKALREAKGKWIAFLDSDDIWEITKLEKQLKFMTVNNYNVSFTDYRICLNGKWSKYVCTGPKKVTLRKLYNYCYFSTITVMYNREKIGLVQIEDLKKNNDYAMWFQVLSKNIAYRLPECLSFYIKHDDSISSGNKTKLIKYHYLLYRNALKKSRFMSFLFTINNLFYGFLKKVFYRRKGHDYEKI